MVRDFEHEPLRVVTWAEVIEKRRLAQREHLKRLRGGEPKERAYKLWMAYFDMALMGGWHAFLETYGGNAWNNHGWIDRDMQWLRPILLRAFPLLLPLGSEHSRWEAWKPVFAEAHARRRQDRHPVGVAYVWWDGRPAGELRPAARREA
jgi:hypothetical protein